MGLLRSIVGSVFMAVGTRLVAIGYDIEGAPSPEDDDLGEELDMDDAHGAPGHHGPITPEARELIDDGVRAAPSSAPHAQAPLAGSVGARMARARGGW